tara:strand:- start:4676 stop:5086 length:411 start_codon:yes stop_codon:yes gene_type:complete
MQNYYTAREDKSGDYVTSNHTRYSVSEINPARVHIPAGREGDMVLLDSIEEFLTSMGLVHLDDHTFPEPEPLDLEAVKASLRPVRNRLLAASDWTQLNDSTLSEDKLAAWSAYRQELRDLTDEIDENGEVEFPVAP